MKILDYLAKYSLILSAIVWTSIYAYGQSYPTPTFQSLTIQGLTSGDCITNTTGTLADAGSPCYSAVGVTDGSTSAAAGKIGEVKTCDVPGGSAQQLTSATSKDVCSIALTAGAWRCTGNWHSENQSSGPTVNTFSAWLSNASATAPASGELNGQANLGSSNIGFNGTATVMGFNLGPVAFDTSSGETAYLTGYAAGTSFSTNVIQWGSMRCERWR